MVAKNKNKKPRFIVQNQAFSVSQSYTIVKCMEQESCTIFDTIGSPPPQNRCEQKYGHVKLNVFEFKNQTIVKDDFYIPSCCVCTYNSKSIFPIKVRRS